MANHHELTFEEAMKKLETIVQQLESGTFSLEQSVDLYEQGMRLSLHCEQKLKQAEQKIEILTQTKDSGFSKQPFVVPDDQGESV